MAKVGGVVGRVAADGESLAEQHSTQLGHQFLAGIGRRSEGSGKVPGQTPGMAGGVNRLMGPGGQTGRGGMKTAAIGNLDEVQIRPVAGPVAPSRMGTGQAARVAAAAANRSDSLRPRTWAWARQPAMRSARPRLAWASPTRSAALNTTIGRKRIPWRGARAGVPLSPTPAAISASAAEASAAEASSGEAGPAWSCCQRSGRKIITPRLPRRGARLSRRASPQPHQ